VVALLGEALFWLVLLGGLLAFVLNNGCSFRPYLAEQAAEQSEEFGKVCVLGSLSQCAWSGEPQAFARCLEAQALPCALQFAGGLVKAVLLGRDEPAGEFATQTAALTSGYAPASATVDRDEIRRCVEGLAYDICTDQLCVAEAVGHCFVKGGAATSTLVVAR
jgi:hypothetical protein